MLKSGKKSYRFLESVPGLLSWTILGLMFVLAQGAPLVLTCLVLAYSIYWIISCVRIIVSSYRGHRRMAAVAGTDWKSRLENEFPDFGDYYYCTLIPFASESLNVLRPTVERLASGNFPANRKILVLSSEFAVPQGRQIASLLAEQYAEHFSHIFVTEHRLGPGEIKGKSSNQNHAGRFLYNKISELKIDPGKVLLSSNDADMIIEPHYEHYLLYSYLTEGEKRDLRIYQPIPADYNGFWESGFFSRILITAGVLWRVTLAMRANYRFTVYAFYSMSLKTLHNLGYWDVDLIPEDERTMFNAIAKMGTEFKVVPLFSLVRGTPVQGSNARDAFAKQYVQIRRWAWGASEFAHSTSIWSGLSRDARKSMLLPMINQLRTSTEWALSPILLLFAGLLPMLFHPEFSLDPVGSSLLWVLSLIMHVSTIFIVAIILLSRSLAPRAPKSFGIGSRLLDYATWLLTPIVGLVFGAIPALDAQTRLLLNKRISYVETMKDLSLIKPVQRPRDSEASSAAG